MSDDDRLLNSIRRQERVLDDGCATCNGSKVYCRAVAWVIGGETKCCDSCSHDGAS